MGVFRRRSNEAGARRGQRRAIFVPFSVMASRFDGVDESAEIGDVAALKFIHTDPFSISVWFKTSTSAANLYLFSKKLHSGALQTGYALSLGTSTRLEVRLHNDRGSNEITIYYTHAAGLYRDGEWHQAVFTYDGSATAAGVTLYIDGAVQTPSVQDDTLSATIDTAAVASIGSQNGSNRFFSGDLDEVSAWDVELSAGEVAETFDDNGPVELVEHSQFANCVGWWRLGDADAYPAITDRSSNSNDATLLNMEGADFVSAEHPP